MFLQQTKLIMVNDEIPNESASENASASTGARCNSKVTRDMMNIKQKYAKCTKVYRRMEVGCEGGKVVTRPSLKWPNYEYFDKLFHNSS